MPKPHNHTNAFIWCAGILCAIIAVVVIISGIVLFVGYLTIKPKIPDISVATAQLDTIYFDQSSLLTLQVTVVIKAENDNTRARATFYNTRFSLSLGGGQKIAYLHAGTFNLAPNKSLELSYMPQSGAIPLSPEEADVVSLSMRRGVMNFDLTGTSRTRWQFGFVHSFKFVVRVNCRLQLPLDGSAVYPNCSSRAK
ncbi:NDR1/HIN1-like protein 12 [Andrographis paniculata]|uniref:NDR1/HIN1-like protein 12 n=1 Tax=Andrographis paniculata TaxID=175694 RepID=UPI0021E92452|nr:NDR1/HIN1-like protein 12 [Andrographis paniculata]